MVFQIMSLGACCLGFQNVLVPLDVKPLAS